MKSNDTGNIAELIEMLRQDAVEKYKKEHGWIPITFWFRLKIIHFRTLEDTKMTGTISFILEMMRKPMQVMD